jgi:hypothetical protein
MAASTSMRDFGLRIINHSANDAFLDRMEHEGDVSFPVLHPVLLNGQHNKIKIQGKSENPSAAKSNVVIAIHLHDVYGNNYVATARYNGGMSDTTMQDA